MHFRIPQALDDFKASAAAGGIVSEQSFSTASTASDRWSILRLCAGNKASYRDAAWSEELCYAAYHVLLELSRSGWSCTSDLRTIARALSLLGASATSQRSAYQQPQNQANAETDMPKEAALGLTIFFTCQMLHLTNVSTKAGCDLHQLVDYLLIPVKAPDACSNGYLLQTRVHLPKPQAQASRSRATLPKFGWMSKLLLYKTCLLGKMLQSRAFSHLQLTGVLHVR